MFALSCNRATTKSTTVYADKELTQPIATVPAQTFANDGYTPMDPSFYEFYDENGNRIMTQYYDYITPSGKRGAGWMNISAVASCYVKLDGGDGNSQNHLLQVKLGRVDYGFEASDDDPVWGDMIGSSDGTNTGKQNNSSSGKTDRASSGKSSKMLYALITQPSPSSGSGLRFWQKPTRSRPKQPEESDRASIQQRPSCRSI